MMATDLSPEAPQAADLSGATKKSMTRLVSEVAARPFKVSHAQALTWANNGFRRQPAPPNCAGENVGEVDHLTDHINRSE